MLIAARERAGCHVNASLVGPTHQAAMQDAPPQDSVWLVEVGNKQIVAPVSLNPAAATVCSVQPLTPQHQPSLVTTSITKVAHLQAQLQLPQPQPVVASMQAVLLALPAAWRAVAQSTPPAPAWMHATVATATTNLVTQKKKITNLFSGYRVSV